MRQRETRVPFISSHRASSYSLFTTATPCHEHSSLLFISGMRTSYSSISTKTAKLSLADKENLRDALRTLKSVFHLPTTNSHDHLKNRSGRRGSNPQHPAWESTLDDQYFQHLQIGSRKMYVHAAYTVHAVPDLRIAAGRLRDGFLSSVAVHDRRFKTYFFVPEASRYSRFVVPKSSMVRRPLPYQRSDQLRVICVRSRCTIPAA